jgi:hypothetical protein
MDIRNSTVSARVHRAYRAQKIAFELVKEACWFECTPLPDDFWEFSVKYERRVTLEAVISRES